MEVSQVREFLFLAGLVGAWRIVRAYMPKAEWGQVFFVLWMAAFPILALVMLIG